MRPTHNRETVTAPIANRALMFNISRLASRQHSSTPTGVDRLDLRHANYVLEQADNTTVVFVDQQKDVLRLVRTQYARQLITNVWQRWVESQEQPPLPKRNRPQRLIRWLHMRFLRRTSTFISPKLKRRLQGHPAPIYLNSGQVGIHHLHLHQRLIDELGAQIIYYLHDLIPIDYPEYARTLAATEIHRQRMETMAKTGATILTNSEYTKRRFQSYCREQHLPVPELSVLPIGVEERFTKATHKLKQPIPTTLALQPTPPYFITIGTIEPRKNHLLVLHIWRRLASELGGNCPTLVILGRRGWENENIIDLLDRSPAIREHVIELNRVNDTEMLALLQNARSLLLPSFEEGWGIPVTEALTVGTPVICSDIPALRESTQGQATLLDPLDGAQWQQTIREFMSSPRPVPINYTPHDWPEHLDGLTQRLAAQYEPAT